jgi:hypothetical protein
MSALRRREGGDDADQCLSVLLQLHWLRSDTATEARRLLYILLVWFGAMSAHPS